MRRNRTCIALAVLAAASASSLLAIDRAGAPRESGRPRLTLTFVDFGSLPAATLAAVQEESARILGALDVEADLRTSAPGATLDPDEVTLIVMDGWPPGRLRPGVMGAVQRQGSARVLWIYPANVAAGIALGWEGRHAWPDPDRDAFATAMARVAVHEVVHLVCPWRGHDRKGLMSAMLDRKALVGSRIPVSSDLRRDVSLGVAGMAGDGFRMAGEGARARRRASSAND
jgi:hypothetical protein